MQQPSVNSSSEVYLAFCDHVEGAAKAWQQAEILTQKQQDCVQAVYTLIHSKADALRACAAATTAAEKATCEARAAFIVRDVILDLRVMGISDALLNGPALRNRESENYKVVFIDLAAGEITRAKIREQPELVVSLLERFAAIDDFAGKAAAQSAASEAVTKSVAARAALDAAENAESKAGSAELAARLVLRNAIDEAYGLLRAGFPGRRDFVESFFPKRTNDSSSAAAPPAAPPAPPPAGGSGTG